VKKIVWFLALLALGVLALRLAIGDDPLVAHQTPDIPPPSSPRPTGGIPIGQAQMGAAWQTSGPFHYTWSRSLLAADGSRRNEPVYQIDTEDSRPVGDGLQQLDRITMTLFRSGQASGVVHADQAFVAVGRDANGKLSLQEDKEVDLRGMILEGAPGTHTEGLRVAVARARLLLSITALELQTQDLEEPIQVDLTGNRHTSLRGKGLRALIPRERNDPKAVASIEILSDPVLETGGMVAYAKGNLVYREALADGSFTVLLENAVRLHIPLRQQNSSFGFGFSAPDQLADFSPQYADIHSERLTVYGRRIPDTGRPDGPSALDISMIRIVGTPSKLEMQGLEAHGKSFDVIVHPQGELASIIAWGGPCRVAVTRPDGMLYTAASPERLEMHRHGVEAAEALRSHGLPLWTLQQIRNQDAFHLQGESEIASNNQKITATRALRILNGDSKGNTITMDGWGQITVSTHSKNSSDSTIQAAGSYGCRLTKRFDSEELRLGPALPSSFLDTEHPCWSHQYSVRSESVNLIGNGSCHLLRRGVNTEITLLSRDGGIKATGIGLQTEFQQVKSLWVQLQGDIISQIQAAGTPCKAAFKTAHGQIVALMPIFHRMGPAAYQAIAVEHMAEALHLTPEGLFHGCPEQDRTPSITTFKYDPNRGSEELLTRAPRIDLHLGYGQTIIVNALAIGEQLVESSGSTMVKPELKPTWLSLKSRRLLYLPYLVPENVTHGHSGKALPVSIVESTIPSRDWIIADEIQQFAIQDPSRGRLTGNGHRLMLRPTDGSMILIGDPKNDKPTSISRDYEGRLMTATGAFIRAWRDPDLRVHVGNTYPGTKISNKPYVVLRQPDYTNALSHLGLLCESDVELLPTEVIFHGPVNAWSLQPNGQPDPQGLSIRSRLMHMLRHPASQEILRVKATQVDMTWQQLRAQSREVELDLRWHLLIARDPSCATVQMPDGHKLTAEYISVNYETFAVEATHGELQRLPIRRDL
jgi:hypothetical protein